MFGSLWSVIKRHRRKFFFTSLAIGGSYLTLQYLKKKLKEIQDKEANDSFNQTKRQLHFDSNQRTCNITVFSLLPGLKIALQTHVNTEEIVDKIKHNPSNRLEMWQDMKILAFVRTLSTVYSCTILIMLLRVQLNIIAGYIYVDNLLHKNATSSELAVAIPAVQEKYLALIQYFMREGLESLIEAIKTAVYNVLSKISLKQMVSLHDVEHAIKAIRQHLECGVTRASSHIPTMPLCHFMLPAELIDNDLSQHEDRIYEKLVRETRDMIESDDFHSVLQHTLDRGFARTVDMLADQYKAQLTDEKNSINDVTLPMAKLIPVIDQLFYRMCSDSPNPFVQELLLQEPLRDLAANIYEAFSQHELTEEKMPISP